MFLEMRKKRGKRELRAHHECGKGRKREMRLTMCVARVDSERRDSPVSMSVVTGEGGERRLTMSMARGEREVRFTMCVARGERGEIYHKCVKENRGETQSVARGERKVIITMSVGRGERERRDSP
jgi:hypothetical protein